MGSKGIAFVVGMIVILVIAAASLVIFSSLFTYTITVARQQTITESKNSLMPLTVVNSRYLSGDNLAIALAKDEVETTKEIENKINVLDVSTCYRFVIGVFDIKRNNVVIGSQPAVSCNPKYNGKYSSRNVFVFPQVFDGENFVVPGEYTTYD